LEMTSKTGAYWCLELTWSGRNCVIVYTNGSGGSCGTGSGAAAAVVSDEPGTPGVSVAMDFLGSA
jgi:hypothetical protein